VIASVANNGDGTLRVSDVAHGLTEGSIVSIRNTANYNGVYVIDSVNANAFDITAVWVADNTGSWDEGSRLIAGTEAAGTYYCSFSVSGSSAVAAKIYKLVIFKNATGQTKIVTERTYPDTGLDCVSASGIVTIVATDRITIAISGETDGTDFVLEHANVNLYKL
jgi:hypothetical protein